MTLVKQPREQEQDKRPVGNDFRVDVDFEKDYRIRQAKGVLHRKVLSDENPGVVYPPPSAIIRK